MAKAADSYSAAMATVFSWAQERAKMSKSPNKFLNRFANDLREARQIGEHEALAHRREVDPLLIAAEVEALAAYRALEHWGTSWGRCPYRYTPAA
jgi:hypothetical protein